MTEYRPQIGMEIHAHLAMRSKMFCGCSAEYSEDRPNSCVCPICMGAPGALPVVNRQAIVLTVRAAMALNCTIARTVLFERKNYPYPDLVKGYQISQYQAPIGRNGSVDLVLDDGSTKRVRINRVHVEEDTAKLAHTSSMSLMDLNRSGCGLLEIVSEPDIESADEAVAYVRTLRDVLTFGEISRADMERGEFRLEANVSVRPVDSSEPGVRVEIKNLNSFANLRKALEYEIPRQIEMLGRGEEVTQQTVGWHEADQRTFVQRSKEYAHDYRYFPEPDLPPIPLDEPFLEEVRASLPETRAAKLERYTCEFGLSEYDAGVLTEDVARARYFDAVVACDATPKEAANWVCNGLLGLMGEGNISFDDLQIAPEEIAEFVRAFEGRLFVRSVGMDVLRDMVAGQPFGQVVQARGLDQRVSEGDIRAVLARLMDQNEKQTQQLLEGKEKLRNFFVGQVMRETQGKADPAVVAKAIDDEVQERGSGGD
jgi:aspartyl-tRNA(Asn)/glutamyl-tRNA(Gln) amidotransferase subunit B